MRDRGAWQEVAIGVGVTDVVVAGSTGVLGASLTMPGGGFAGDLWRSWTDDPMSTDPFQEAPETPCRQPDRTVVLDDGSEYRFLEERIADDGEWAPVSWSACHPISYVVQTGGGPRDFEWQVDVLMAEMAKLTGLEFVDEGVVVEPSGPREFYQPEAYGDRWAPVLIRWSDEDDEPQLAGDVVGLATSWTDWDEDGTLYQVTGVVDLDVEISRWKSWGDGEPGYVPILRHELGHILGLDHVDDPNELMHAESDYAWYFSPGDVAGLEILGQGGCATGFDPQP